MTGQDRIIDKVRKLLAVANDSATGNGVEHEQETAMRQALAMLAKHNLSMSDITDLDEKEDRDCIEITDEYPCPWRRVIAQAVARMFFCQYFKTQVPNKQKYNYSFVGLESNAITAKEMVLFLMKSVNAESLRRQKEQNEGVAFGTTFRNAAANRIAARCDALRKETESDASLNVGSALVMANYYEQEMLMNDSYISKVLGIKLKTKSVKGQIKSVSGAQQGVAFGNNVSLNRQVSNNTPAPVLRIG